MIHEIEAQIEISFSRCCYVTNLAQLGELLEPIREWVMSVNISGKNGTQVKVAVPNGQRPLVDAVLAGVGDMLRSQTRPGSVGEAIAKGIPV